MQISARNQLVGRVRKITTGLVNAEVVIELEGGAELVAVITKTSAQSLGLKKGREVHAVIKASDVMVGICCGHAGCDCGK